MANNIKKLTIGLLKCDTFIPEVKGKFGDIDQQFRNLLSTNTLSTKIELPVFEVAENQFPSKEDILNKKYNGFIITGSRSSVNDDNEWTNTLKDYIRFFSENKIKTVGICYGHQAIAVAMGGEVTTTSKGWAVSDHPIKIVEKNSFEKQHPKSFNDLFNGKSNKDSINIIFSNKQVVSKTPEGFEIFAYNDYSTNQAMYKKDQFYSFQGHPEYTPDLIKEIISRRRGLIPDDVIEDGLKRADKSNIDKSTFSNSIIDFFLEKQQ
ncbi:hypothetical protein DICPUDRAFT_91450 [Dictyostelium purpureum]|uniref:Glutamine amidotransferase domain-containing protein n=1 Tax=Dictyostelium purpureum TaxID=5786 RepID=F0ZCK9_DICPU|nr:uncharacterized protein DICPUDRAFT_91450 [Dictyostelium purpureum]EGC38286.1 hypothetical protein DICPUDRAFT_91450 [Dictyostelium purpureum]|eukprot:XP_003285147.1 hypothetical protein DICPUDRAFT_91450 [Dictyostelium purpureum]